jgi:hypothetical protein
MPDYLPADVADALAALDGSTQSFDVLSGVALKALAKTNELGRRVDKTIEHVQRIDELMTAIARRLRRLEALPDAISPDEVKESALRPVDTRRARRGRPRGAKNKKTLMRERLAELTSNGLDRDTAA